MTGDGQILIYPLSDFSKNCCQISCTYGVIDEHGYQGNAAVSWAHMRQVVLFGKRTKLWTVGDANDQLTYSFNTPDDDFPIIDGMG